MDRASTTYGKEELEIAGSLGEGGRMVKCKTVDIEVPAEAEMVLEGRSSSIKWFQRVHSAKSREPTLSPPTQTSSGSTV